MRSAMQDLQFSNGIRIPKGTIVAAAAVPMHMDEEIYPNPNMFNPWRFSDLRQEDGEGLKHQFVSTSAEYVPFGHGRHAW